MPNHMKKKESQSHGKNIFGAIERITGSIIVGTTLRAVYEKKNYLKL